MAKFKGKVETFSSPEDSNGDGLEAQATAQGGSNVRFRAFLRKRRSERELIRSTIGNLSKRCREGGWIRRGMKHFPAIYLNYFDSCTTVELSQSSACDRICPGHLPYKTQEDLDFLLSIVEKWEPNLVRCSQGPRIVRPGTSLPNVELGDHCILQKKNTTSSTHKALLARESRSRPNHEALYRRRQIPCPCPCPCLLVTSPFTKTGTVFGFTERVGLGVMPNGLGESN